MFSLTIVVSFHGTFVTKVDRAYRCMCFFRNVKHLTSGIDMQPIQATELMDTAEMPKCTYSIHSNAPNGPQVVLVIFIYRSRRRKFFFLISEQFFKHIFDFLVYRLCFKLTTQMTVTFCLVNHLLSLVKQM